MATRKTTKKATKKPTRKMAAKTKAKVARKTKARSDRPQSSRELQALQRLDTLTKTYQAAGMSPQDARQRALDELRINARRDSPKR
jgi:hypothetical protein